MELHNRLLIKAARDILRPMGLCQKGQSRSWWDDHGSWLIQVEFQPSGFGKGSYLNVGVGGLWTDEPRDHVAFNYGHRVEGLTAYQSPEQWEAVAYSLARHAGMAPTSEGCAGHIYSHPSLFADCQVVHVSGRVEVHASAGQPSRDSAMASE